MKIFTLMAFAMSLFFSLLDGLGMSPLAFKNVNKFFKPGLEYNSPIFGCVALNAGVVENLRFYNVKTVYKADGTRDYINDRVPGNDPIMEIVKILFPSPAGSLATETSSSQNFGRYCGPEHVASLLNFCCKIRTFFSENPTVKLPKAFGKALVRLRFNDENINRFPQDPFSKTPKSRLLKNILLAIQNELSTFAHENAMSDDAPQTAVLPFYPQYFPEQLITAFFCHKFADQNDIEKFIRALSPKIIDQKMIESIDTLIDKIISIDDLHKVLDKKKSYSLDDLWIVLNREEFYSPLPYQSRQRLISHGLAQIYDREQNQFIDKSFADCFEVALRHIINLFLYDSTKNNFNFEHFDRHLKDRSSPFVKNLKHFYGYFDRDDMQNDSSVIQTPDKANTGSESLRSAWNRVIANLSNPDIIYRRSYGTEVKTNELAGTMLNLVRVLKTLFNLDLGPEPIYEKGNEKSFISNCLALIEECFQRLCRALNPKLQSTIEFNSLKITEVEGKIDLVGYILFSVFNQETNVVFKFMLKANLHSEILSLIIEQKSVPPAPETVINCLVDQSKSKTIFSSLQLLEPQVLINASFSFYTFLKKLIDDNASIIVTLEAISHVQANKQIALIVQNLLSNFLWEDIDAIQTISPLFSRIAQHNPGLFNALKDKILGFALSEGNSPEFIAQLKNVKYFIKSDKKIIENVTIPEGMDCLEELILNNSSIKSLILFPAPRLKAINLADTSNLEEFIIPEGMDSLEEINLRRSGVQSLTLAKAPLLKTINLALTSNLEELVIPEGMDSLEILNFKDSVIEKITLAPAPKLKTINGKNVSSLKELIIPEGMDSLEVVDISGSDIEKITLATAPQLESIYCEDRCQEEKIKISGAYHCPNLDREELLKFAILEDDESESCKRKRNDEVSGNTEKRVKYEENNDNDMDAD